MWEHTLFYKVKNTKKHLSRVYGVQRYPCFTFKKVDEIYQRSVNFGITSKMIVGYEFPTVVVNKCTNLFD